MWRIAALIVTLWLTGSAVAEESGILFEMESGTRLDAKAQLREAISRMDRLTITPSIEGGRPIRTTKTPGLPASAACHHIESVMPTSRTWRKSFRIRFRAGDQEQREIELMPKKPQEFATALSGAIENARASRTSSS